VQLLFTRRSALGLTVALGVLVAAAVGSAASSASTAALSGKGVSVVYIPGLTGNPFYDTVACGASVEAKKLGASFSVQGAPTFSVEAQTPVVDAVVARHPSAIMISNDDPKAMIPPLLKAQQAGIKIINIDGDLSEKSIGVTNIQSNDTQGGQLAGQEMVKLLKGKKGTILILDNEPGVDISAERRNGFTAALKTDSGLTVLSVEYTNNEVSTAASDVRAVAAAHSDLLGVYTVETNNTQGALTGLEEAKLTGKVKLIGYDTSAPIVAGIKSGAISADIVQYPYGEGMLGLQDAVEAAHGQSVPREQTQPFVVATKANVNTAKVQQFIYKTSCTA
jgi:ribose transport system substrate-binding protein